MSPPCSVFQRGRVVAPIRHMAGYYAMYRGWMNHPAIAEKIYSRRDAWCWLIENAAWSPMRKPWKNKIIVVNRGQVAASIRVLAEEWGWSVNRVVRFLDVLKTDTMVDTQTDTGMTIITICNYNEYQAGIKQTDTQADTQADTVTDTTKRREKNIRKNNTPLPPSGESQVAFSLEAENENIDLPEDRFPVFMKIYPNKKDRSRAKKSWDKATLAADPETIIAAAHQYAAECKKDKRPDSAKYIKHAATWLNNACWTDYDHYDDEDDAPQPWNLGARL